MCVIVYAEYSVSQGYMHVYGVAAVLRGIRANRIAAPRTRWTETHVPYTAREGCEREMELYVVVSTALGVA